MYLYQLAFKEYVNAHRNIREVVLLQHEQEFDDVEFEQTIDHYYRQGVSEFEILDKLKKEGFRVVPKVIY